MSKRFIVAAAVLGLAACSSSSSSSGSSGSSSSGGNAVNGALGFTPKAIVAACGNCGTEIDLNLEGFCGQGNGPDLLLNIIDGAGVDAGSYAFGGDAGALAGSLQIWPSDGGFPPFCDGAAVDGCSPIVGGTLQLTTTRGIQEDIGTFDVTLALVDGGTTELSGSFDTNGSQCL